MPTNVGALSVFGAIEQKWLTMGGVGGALGAPVTNEAPTFDGVGRAQSFQKAIVSWHPKTGAQVVWGAIGGRWLEVAREKFGYPVTDELTCPDQVGKFNHFRALHLAGTPDGSIYWSPASGAHEVYGAIRDKWAALGWERSALGYPLEAERDAGGGNRAQKFQHGEVVWNAAAGASEHVVSGDSITFDSGPVTSPLPLGGTIHLVVQRNGNFTFSTHAHDSGFDNIEYAMSAVLVTRTGTAFTFAHTGHVEGTSAGLPFGTPDRNSDMTSQGNNAAITSEWDNLVNGGKLIPHLSGQDTLAGALNDLLAEAAKAIGAAAVKAVVQLVAA